jgi:hypothetical protein
VARGGQRWDFFHRLTVFAVGIFALVWTGFFLAVSADLAFRLQLGFGWKEFWILLAILVVGAPVSLLTLVVQGVFRSADG